MLIRKAFKFALKPTPEQAKKLAQGAGCVRLVWNKALALQKEKLTNKEKIFTYNELAGKLTEWKKTQALQFLGDAQSQPLQQTLKDLDRAMKDGFKKEKGMPRFKKKDRVEDGMKFPQGFKISGRKLFVPKIGLVKTHWGRSVVGDMKNLTLKKEAGNWYASIQVESEIEIKEHKNPMSMVGIDLGVKQFATLSNGAVVEPLSAYRKYEKKLAKAQVEQFRREKGSKGRAEARLKVQKIHKKIHRMRQDFLHKASHWIAKNHGIVVLEDLQVKNMSRSAKGSVEEAWEKRQC
jgi:putative transposase